MKFFKRIYFKYFKFERLKFHFSLNKMSINEELIKNIHLMKKTELLKEYGIDLKDI